MSPSAGPVGRSCDSKRLLLVTLPYPTPAVVTTSPRSFTMTVWAVELDRRNTINIVVNAKSGPCGDEYTNRHRYILSSYVHWTCIHVQIKLFTV